MAIVHELMLGATCHTGNGPSGSKVFVCGDFVSMARERHASGRAPEALGYVTSRARRGRGGAVRENRQEAYGTNGIGERNR